MVKISNQAIFILLCFWLGSTLHEQETAQSGQFAQTSNLLFPGPGKSKMAQTSNLFFPRPGKSKRLRLPICFFPGREKAKWFRFPICFFPTREKAIGSLFLQRGQVTNMTCADLSQDLREPFATAVRAHSKSAFEIRLLTRKRWVFERRSYKYKH